MIMIRNYIITNVCVLKIVDRKLRDPILSPSFLNIHGFVQKKKYAIFYDRSSKYLLYDKDYCYNCYKHRMYKV